MKQIWLDLTQSEQTIEILEATEIYAVFVGRNDEKRKLKLNIVHKLPELTSLVLIKSVLFEQSQLEIEGNLIIEKGARQTDTYLKAAILMMSPHSRARAVPSLEIMEDNVKGGHGATVGKVDPEELFYLQAKGIPYQAAVTLLVEGFLADIVGKLKDPELIKQVTAELAKLPDERE